MDAKTFLLIILSSFQINLTNATLGTVFEEHKQKEYDSEWKSWKMYQEKEYKEEFEEVKRSVWVSNFKETRAHNDRFAQGLEFYQQDLNWFSDRRPEDLIRKLLPSVDFGFFHMLLEPVKFASKNEPPNLDWTLEGWILSFQPEYFAPTGWAYSALRSVEAQLYNVTGTHTRFSRQEIVDCAITKSKRPHVTLDAFSYILQYGVTLKFLYPESYRKDAKCERREHLPHGSIQGYYLIEPGNELTLKTAVALIGPISVSIVVTSKFFFYSSGVFYDTMCTYERRATNHAVLLVGYGKDPIGGDYWIIQNSWGNWWGEAGFARMARNTEINCGIPSAAIYPVV